MRGGLLLCVIGGLCFEASLSKSYAQGDGIPRFIDVTRESGIDFEHINGPKLRKDYIFEAKGGGVGFVDYDQDGWLDVLLAQGATLEGIKRGNAGCASLFRNRGDGTFVEVSKEAGLDCKEWGMGVTFGDYDNDGDADIYLTALTRSVLYRNEGNGTFEDVTEQSGAAVSGWSTSAAFGDYDLDGDLDLYVAKYLDCGVDRLPPKTLDCTYLGEPVLCGPRGLQGAADHLFRNRGDGTFEDVTAKAGAVDEGRYFGLGVIWADANNDNRPDIIVANDATPNLLFVNRGDGTFEEMGFLSGLAVSGSGNEQASMGVDAADYDNDGLMDVFFAHFAADYSTLYHNEGDLFFRDVSSSARLEQPEWFLVSWGTCFLDVNNDGWKDLIHSNGHVYPYLSSAQKKERYAQPSSLFLNQRDGTFRDVSAFAGDDFMQETVSRGVGFGDYDNDGDVDLIISNMNSSPQLLRNDRTDNNHWVMFRLVGTSSNRDGLGARVTVVTDDLTQVREVRRSVGIYSASDPSVHFGLGKAQEVSRLEVLWPSGEKQRFEGVAAGVHYVIDEDDGIRKTATH
jgi:hypothetical protein